MNARAGFATACLSLLAAATLAAPAVPAGAAEGCPNEALRLEQQATYLSDCRAYEMVSPAAKRGTGVISDSQRTRAAADGSAVGFVSLGAFADAMGTGVATEYMSQRVAIPGTPGWVTHATSPLQSGTTLDGNFEGLEPMYYGDFTPDLTRGVFFASSPLTGDPATANVPNLYRRTDLRAPGAGTYDLLTRCPLCDEKGSSLAPPTSPEAAAAGRPILVGWSPDTKRIAFQSALRLTGDTPVVTNRIETYEWNDGTVSLAGRLPTSGSVCDDLNGPPCVGAKSSIAGRGPGTPHVVSDGSDGHTRVFFTYPTTDGVALALNTTAGQVYMRVDGTTTIQLNASERGTPDSFAPAEFLAASADGERAFFRTAQALTDDTPADGASHLYMYDATAPSDAPDNLTLVNPDAEPGDVTFSSADGVVGVSDDARYVYFITKGQIVNGAPLLPGLGLGLFVWHDGVVRFIASLEGAAEKDLLDVGAGFGRQARVTPDGRWLLYRALSGSHLALYLYGADSDSVVCVSCSPSGPTTADATDVARTNIGGTGTSWHENHPLADDGSRVFFSTTQSLVPGDTNGADETSDVYEYDVASGSVHLISSGTSSDDSWFMDASADGSDVFFTTSQRLVGWDRDYEYDVYDARVDGGFPEPPPVAAACQGETCLGPVAPPPGLASIGSTEQGPGNPPIVKCPRGRKPRQVAGSTRCVKRRKHSRRKHHHRPPRKSHRRSAHGGSK